jgi:ribonuclease VapC
MKRSYVLDSWAMMAFFENEPAAATIEKLILEAHARHVPLAMSMINAGELWYATARAYSALRADAVLEELAALRIGLLAPDWETTKLAARFKSMHHIAYADCFAAATAKLRKGTVVTGDPEFAQLENDVKILWV